MNYYKKEIVITPEQRLSETRKKDVKENIKQEFLNSGNIEVFITKALNLFQIDKTAIRLNDVSFQSFAYFQRKVAV